MSAIVRQDGMFAGEDFRKVYKAFQDVDFTAYDFDSLKNALIEYIRAYYPEDFNDYIESSEFIAIIELLAYYGTSLAFRTDLNSRENIIDTAERRESIIRLARMVNYQPKRNLPSQGLFKLVTVQTNEPLTDANDVEINNVPIFWNDPNNVNWFDQFIQILNAAFNSSNPFGRPSKSGTIGNISTDLYQFNNVLGLDVAYNVSISVNGESIPIDIVNPDFNTGETFFERHPDPNEAFNLIYRNDTLGVASANTGFFAYFRQGQMIKTDHRYDFPVPNRVTAINIENINQDDVYVQEINDAGVVLEKWTKVPSLVGNNVIYNTINFNERNIYEVISGLNDRIQLKFADGNFANVPTGTYRTWVRPSINRNIIIRPADARGITITVPYTGKDSIEYNLIMVYDLELTVNNSAPSETNTQVKLRAPRAYYTQDRMINNQDYNVLPLIYGNQITKLTAINRTFAGHSRYIDINDPTGFHKDLIVFGEDGALYKEEEPNLIDADIPSDADSSITLSLILQNALLDDSMQTFFYDTYLPLYDNLFSDDSNSWFRVDSVMKWKTLPDKASNNTGYFVNDSDNLVTLGSGFTKFIKDGAILKFENPNNNNERITVTAMSVTGSGIPTSSSGPIMLSKNVRDGWQLIQYDNNAGITGNGLLPAFRANLTEEELAAVKELLGEVETTSFGYGYDLSRNNGLGEWYILKDATGKETFSISRDGITGAFDQTDNNSWFLYARYLSPAETGQGGKYEFTTQGITYVFESLKDVRFYWDPEQKIYDSTTGKALQDTIEILPFINFNSDGEPLIESIVWHIAGMYVYDDGFRETARIEVSPADQDEDGTPDKPLSFNKLVSPDDYVVFEIYIDDNNYQRARPLLTNWADLTAVESTGIVVDIPNKTINGYSINENGLFNLKDDDSMQAIAGHINSSNGLSSTSPQEVLDAREFTADLINTTFRIDSLPIADSEKFKNLKLVPQNQYVDQVIIVLDERYYEKNGVSFNQDSNQIDTQNKDATLDYKWKHYAPTDQRIDPAISNIIDMVILTEDYYNSVLVWKENNNRSLAFPLPPTTEELRTLFSNLEQFKSISDQIIYSPGKFKVLFGIEAEPELQATFKVVKIPTTNVSDNEIKTEVIKAIDEYFVADNWDYGETFFYTELAAYIHSRLAKLISSVVIVPNKSESEFGNLFEITSLPHELFISTATVTDVEIVKNLTETNLRV